MTTSTLDINVRTRNAERNVKELDKDLKRLDRTGTKVASTFKGLGPLIAGLVTFETLRQLAKLSDSYTNIQSRLRLATDGTLELAEAQDRLFQISQDTFTQFEANVNTFQRFEIATRSLNISQNELLNVQEALALSFRISGTDAVGAAQASIQLAQGLGAGALRGDEFRSVSEQNVKLLQLLADELDVNVGSLKDLAAEGKITSEVVTKALGGSLEELRVQFETLSPTIAGGFIQIHNALIAVAGAFEEGSGASSGFSESLTALATALKGSVEGFKIFGAGISQVFSSLQFAVTTFFNLAGLVDNFFGADGGFTEGLKAFRAQQALLTKQFLTSTAERQTAIFGLSEAEQRLNDIETETLKNRKELEELGDFFIKEGDLDDILEAIPDSTKGVLEFVEAIALADDAFNKLFDNRDPVLAIQEDAVALTQEIIRLGTAAGWTDEQFAEAFARINDGAQEALGDLETDIVNLQSVAEDFAKGAADAFIDFATGAEDSFSKFAASFLKQIASMIIQAQILKALESTFPSLFGSSTAPPSLTSSANGNVFSSNVVPFARGGVVNKPTLFPMANGAGLMGEAGPEAIMPLRRGADGKLGVSGGGTTVNVINNSSQVKTEVTESSTGDITVNIMDIVNDGLSNGSFDGSLNANFGVNRKGF